MSMPIRVIILSREDCHLCDVVYRMAARIFNKSYPSNTENDLSKAMQI